LDRQNFRTYILYCQAGWPLNFGHQFGHISGKWKNEAEHGGLPVPVLWGCLLSFILPIKNPFSVVIESGKRRLTPGEGQGQGFYGLAKWRLSELMS
jgi:hypothetical protein